MCPDFRTARIVHAQIPTARRIENLKFAFWVVTNPSACGQFLFFEFLSLRQSKLLNSIAAPARQPVTPSVATESSSLSAVSGWRRSGAPASYEPHLAGPGPTVVFFSFCEAGTRDTVPTLAEVREVCSKTSGANSELDSAASQLQRRARTTARRHVNAATSRHGTLTQAFPQCKRLNV